MVLNLPDVEGWRHLKQAVLNTGKIYPENVFGRESPGDVAFLGDQVVPAKKEKNLNNKKTEYKKEDHDNLQTISRNASAFWQS
jgi:hypothetical protein